MELEQRKKGFERRGMNVAALSYDNMQVLHHFAQRVGITYPLLSDPASKVIRAFGILNDSIPRDNMSYGVPFPGSYVIDRDGIVREKYFEPDYRERYTSSNILTRHFNETSGIARTSVDTGHLRLTYGATNTEVRPGVRLSLVLEVELRAGMHVYAPEVQDPYIPIDWKIASSGAWRAQEVAYPPSKKLHLPAIQETVPVYEGSIKLTRDLTIGPSKEVEARVKNGELTVEGSFRYQACDDKVCYRPETVPLRWTFRVLPHDRERAPEEIRKRYP